jgi:SAM-dependent methyltransferase
VSRVTSALARTPTGRWTVWKFNWLANHKIIAALERARRHARGVLLDVGCGSRPFAPLFEGRVERYLGVDLWASRFLGGRPPDAYARGEALPFRAASMDTVLGLSVLTYLPEPGKLIAEAHRVLRPGGTLLLEFTQMVPLHDEPHDYFRFTRYGAAFLLERAGFEPLEFIPIGGLMSRVGLSAIAALNRINRGPTRVITEIPVRILYVVLQLVFEGLDRLFFDPREVLAHLAVARKK